MMPQEACEALLDVLIPAAENLLRKSGQFYPIRATLTAEDNILRLCAKKRSTLQIHCAEIELGLNIRAFKV